VLHSPAAYVFGDAIGGRLGDPKKAWMRACTAAGITDLHFHDLRHEAGWPLHHVQEMLGHADLKQTSTYLNVTQIGLQDSMRRFGTQPLQAVASEPASEHPPAGNEQPTKLPQVTVN
jgi:integrase